MPEEVAGIRGPEFDLTVIDETAAFDTSAIDAALHEYGGRMGAITVTDHDLGVMSMDQYLAQYNLSADGDLYANVPPICGQYWPGHGPDTPADRVVRCDRAQGHEGRHSDSRYPDRSAANPR